MSLIKKITLTVKGYEVSLSEPLRLYQNDAIKLIFEVNEFGVDVVNNAKIRTIMPINPLKAYLFIDTPNDDDDSIESASVVDNQIEFLLSEKYTKNVGVSQMQILLVDEDGCRVTLPEFDFEIKQNIFGNFSVVESVLGDVDETILVTDDGFGIKFDMKIKKEVV